jgi:hypothetical protein
MTSQVRATLLAHLHSIGRRAEHEVGQKPWQRRTTDLVVG